MYLYTLTKRNGKPPQISLQSTARKLNHKKWNKCHLLEALAICHFLEVQNTNI